MPKYLVSYTEECSSDIKNTIVDWEAITQYNIYMFENAVNFTCIAKTIIAITKLDE